MPLISFEEPLRNRCDIHSQERRSIKRSLARGRSHTPPHTSGLQTSNLCAQPRDWLHGSYKTIDQYACGKGKIPGFGMVLEHALAMHSHIVGLSAEDFRSFCKQQMSGYWLS